MTVKDVEREVALISSLAEMRDDEAAHSAEATLFERVLRAIAEGAEDPAGLAAAVLKSTNLDFCRWFA